MSTARCGSPLNLFPADFLASLSIIKSYTPDLPGDFSGGLVDINLVTFPTEFEASIGMSLAANSSATFQDFNSYKGQGGAPSGMLVFDVELLSITKPPQVPPDVKAVPTDAKRTPSGLAYKVIKAGTGTRHPSARNQVTVHYSGWTTDGKMFDSSVTRGEAATFPLDGVIAGWTEGVQLMVEGETTRFWIPGPMAYGDTPTRPGAPAGMLVFDVELLKILK